MPPREMDDYRINLTASGEFKRQLAFLRRDTSLEAPSVIRLAVAELAKKRGYHAVANPQDIPRRS